ncbi:MAG TPA: hypothetical protein VEW28_04900 [Candidatus Kapabacteria bacterium]|nr:hypothetical protein [Candidatus Kapabacteria bacterium]
MKTIITVLLAALFLPAFVFGQAGIEGKSASQLAIIPSLTHYTICSSPRLAETVIPFLDNNQN